MTAIRLPLAALLWLWLVPAGAQAQQLVEYPAPVEVDFPAGYDIHGPDGKFVKSVPGPAKAKVQAHFEKDGFRLYLSDWSYDRFKRQGIRPNLMVAKDGAANPPEPDEPQQVADAPSPETARVAAEIEAAISSWNLERAAALVARIESTAAGAGPAEKAATFYYSGVISFLAGDRDRETEAAFKNALGLYVRGNDVEGVWGSLYLLQKLYFDIDRKNSDLWTQLNAVEAKVIRSRLGLAPGSGPVEIFEKLSEEEPLSSLKRKLDDVFSRLSEDPVHGERIRDDQESWKHNRDESLGQLGFERNAQLPRFQYYLEGREKLNGVKKRFSQEAEGLLRRQLDKLNRIESAITLSPNRHRSESVVEGFNWSGGRWAYEFVKHSIEPTLNLATDSAGVVLFADSEFVVRSVELEGSWEEGGSRRKTELSFYDTKTCRLAALVSIPNRVFEVGSVGDSRGRQFYVGTITPGKYRYDDCPLAITLVDLETESIERIPLVEDDYWFALGHELGVKTAAESIQLTVDKGFSSQYERIQPEKDVFKKIRFSFVERSRASDGWAAHESGEKRHRALISRERSGLAYLGPRPARVAATSSSRGQFAIGSLGGTGLGLILVRATEEGRLTRFDLGTLGKSSQMVSQQGVFAPFVLEDGVIACVAGGGIQLIGEGSKRIVEIPGGNGEALELSLRSPDSYFDRESGTLHFFRNAFAYTVGEKFWRLELPKAEKFEAIVPDRRNLQAGGADAEIIDWVEGTGTFVVRYPGLGGFQRFQKSTGQPFGSRWDGGSAHQVYNGVFSSDPSNGWRALSYSDDASTGGISACVTIEKAADGSDHVKIANGLPSKADPLGLIDAGAKVRVVFGAGDTVQFVEVDPSTGATKAIWIWNFASRFGKALLDQSSGIILIPNAAGFEAWMLPGEGEPRKKFDMVLADDDSFAVLLPNGLYAGSPGCESFLKLTDKSGTLVPAAILAPWRNRPAAVLAAMGGGRSAIDATAHATERWLKRLGVEGDEPNSAATEFATAVAAPRPLLMQSTNELTFPVEVVAGAEPVKSVSVLVNGVAVAELLGGGGAIPAGSRRVAEAKLRLSKGQNWIEIVATDAKDRSGSVDRFRVIREGGPPSARRHIVTLGVSRHKDPQQDLDFAQADASTISSLLKRASPIPAETLHLTNEQVTREALPLIGSFLAKAGEDDEIVLFCAGHGSLDGNLDFVFRTHDLDDSDVAGTGIKLSELLDLMGASKARKRLLMFDSCHSGFVGEREEWRLAGRDPENPEAEIRFLEELFRLPGLVRGVTILAAARGSELAWEREDLGSGFFTAVVKEGLAQKRADLDGDGVIRVSELRDFILERVPEVSRGKDLPNGQTPSVVAFEADQDFILAR